MALPAQNSAPSRIRPHVALWWLNKRTTGWSHRATVKGPGLAKAGRGVKTSKRSQMALGALPLPAFLSAKNKFYQLSEKMQKQRRAVS